MSILLALMCSVLLATSFDNAFGQSSDELREALRNRIEAGRVNGGIEASGQAIRANTVLSRFYEKRVYKAAWIEGGALVLPASVLIRLIEESSAEGLRPDDYHLRAIETLVSRIAKSSGGGPPPLAELVDLDLLLTDAFFVYAADLESGRVNPETIHTSFQTRKAPGESASILEKSLSSNEIETTLKSLAPPFAAYGRLKAALAGYRKIAADGGWPTVPGAGKLKKGSREARVRILRKRLQITGDLPEGASADDDLFDDSLERGVRAFQLRHGIDLDGVVGPATLAALNVPAEKRIRQIELNLERWRWLPRDFGERYIMVNTAAFLLEVVANGNPVMDMRVIVGKRYRDTPVFTAEMTYLVFNPYWHVPLSIAVKDKLPLIRKDAGYLKRENIRVLQDSREIDPSTIDWSALGPGRFPYRLRQDPGPKNALGRIKFMFPNKFNVYLHDTPSKELFARTERTFSSGCIRIEKPIDLAEYLLEGDPKYTRENILAAIARGGEQTVKLPRPIPVHLLYWTAWVDRDGTVEFRKDIYDRDARLDAVL